MEVNQIPVKRGGKPSTTTVGVTADGRSRLYNEKPESPETYGQKVRQFPKRLTIYFNEGDANGEAAQIETTWREVLLAADGTPLHATGRDLTMWTNQADITAFVQLFGAILYAIENGRVRCIEGFNNLPVFGPNGHIPRTEAEENEPPTNDYHPLPPEDANPVNP